MFDPAVIGTLLIGLESARRDLWGATDATDATRRDRARRPAVAGAGPWWWLDRRLRVLSDRRASAPPAAARPTVG